MAHRTAGSGGTDYLSSASLRSQLVSFLLSIDGNTPPIAPTPPLPSLAGGVVDAASFSATVAPGSIASVFGAATAEQWIFATTLPLPTKLGGSTFTVGSTLSPFFFASAYQNNVQIPWEAQPGSVTAMVTVAPNSASAKITVAQYAPGIFTTAQSGTGQGVIVEANGGLAAPAGAFPGSQPATAGDFLTIYCTGLGPVVNQPAYGLRGDPRVHCRPRPFQRP